LSISGHDVEAVHSLHSNVSTTTLTVHYLSSDVNLTSSGNQIEIVSISRLTLQGYIYPYQSAMESVNSVKYFNSTGEYQWIQLRLTGVLNNGDTMDLSDHSSTVYTISDSSLATLTGSILVPNSAGDIVVSASIVNLTTSITITALDDTVTVDRIVSFETSFGRLFSDVRNATSTIARLSLQLSDNTTISNLIVNGSPFLNDLVSFTSSNPDLISINESTGSMTILGNSFSPIDITVHVEDSSVEDTLEVHSNIQPVLGDADFGSIDSSVISPSLVQGSTFTLPVYVNTDDASVGAIHLRVRYNSSVLSAGRATPGDDITRAMFESSYLDDLGEVQFGVIFREETDGNDRMHVANINFTVHSDGHAYIIVDVFSINTYSNQYSPIGASTPRVSTAAYIQFSIGAPTQGPFAPVSVNMPVPSTRCSTHTCTLSECTSIGNVLVGDANLDCVSDMVDALAALIQSSNNSVLTERQFNAMDADKSNRLTSLDANILLKANLDFFPLVSDISLRPIDAQYSDCRLSINVSLEWIKDYDILSSNTYIYFGLFHSTSLEFQTELYDTLLTSGSFYTGPSLPDGSYGAWITPDHYGDGLFGMQTLPGNLSQTDIGFFLVYGDVRSSIQDRSFVAIGSPSSSLSFNSLNVALQTPGSSYVSVNLTSGFNPQQFFNNSFTAELCYNLHTPVIYPATDTIDEDSSIGSLVDTVSATDNDSPLPAGNVRFSMTFVDDTQRGLIAINPVTGQLTVAQTLDRESYASIHLRITATDQGPHIYTRKSDTADFTVNINDVNDNYPIPGKPVYQVDINEDTPVPSGTLLTVNATDNDVAPQHRALLYSIISGDDDNSSFSLNPVTGELSLARSLDRETNQTYNLTVQITDSLSAPILTSYTYIEVTVTDANDNAPVFISNETASIRENNEVGDFILNVTAIDADIDEAAVIVYRIPESFSVYLNNSKISDSGMSLNTEEYFHINGTTGVITAARSFDTEDIFKYQLTIIAENGIQESYQFVYITICEENDNNPIFDRTEYVWNIDENSSIGRLVDTLIATDDDFGSLCPSDASNREDDVIQYYQTSNVTEFLVDETTGQVLVDGSIDYELVHQYTLDILAVDLGVPQLNGTTTLVININDVNDNPPVFAQDFYTDSIVENSTVGTRLGQVMNATDADSGNNSLVRYRLSGFIRNTNIDFTINETTGVITVARPLDRETIAQYDLIVTAYDLGSPSMESNVTLVIVVLDINDSPPRINMTSFDYFQTENTAVGSNILRIIATDADVDNDRSITFAPLFSLDSLTLPFMINESTGYIYTIESLCITSNVTYRFNVTAQDRPGGTLKFETKVTFTITVYDDNSGTPVFERPELAVQLPDGSSSGTHVGTFTAEDDNICSYPLTYSILPVSDHTSVSINSSTGSLTTQVALDRTNKHLYIITLSVSDQGSDVVKSSTTTLYIIVGGVVPINIQSNVGYPVTSYIRESNTVFSQNFSYFYDAILGVSRRLEVSFSTITDSISYLPDTSAAMSVSGELITEEVYYDKPIAYVAVQVLDVDGTTSVDETLVQVQLNLNGDTANGSAITDPSSGIAIVSIDIPPSWFTQDDQATVTCTIPNGPKQHLPDITIYSPPDVINDCRNGTLASGYTSDALLFWFPTYELYRGEKSFINVTFVSDDPHVISALAVECSGNGDVMFLSPQLYTPQYWNYKYVNSDDAITVQITRTGNFTGSIKEEDLIMLPFQVTSSSISMPTVSCRLLYSVDNEGNKQSDSFIINRGSCNITDGFIHVSQRELTSIFVHSSRRILFNKALIDHRTQSTLTFLISGIYTGPVPQRNRIFTGISCSSANPDILKVSSNCQYVYTDGSESNGHEGVVINVNVSAGAFSASKSLTFQVWIPQLPLSVSLSDAVLNSIDGYTPNCSEYQSTQLEVTATFKPTSNSSLQADVRVENIIPSITSSDASIARVDGTTIIGTGSGIANVTISNSRTQLGRVSVNVSNDSVHVVDLDVYYTTSISVSTSKDFSTDDVAVFSGTINQSLLYDRQTGQLVTYAIFSDGYFQMISPSQGLDYNSTDLNILSVGASNLTAINSGSGDILIANWYCSGRLVYSDPNDIDINLSMAYIEAALSNDFIVSSTDPSTSIDSSSFPTMSILTVKLKYNDSNIRDIDITNEATYSLSTPAVTLATVGSTKVIQVTDDTFSGQVLVSISYKTYTAISVTLNVGKSIGISLESYPHPSYVGCCIGGDYHTVISPISGTGVSQKLQVRSKLIVSAGSVSRNIDVTDYNTTVYSSSQPSLATVSDDGIVSVSTITNASFSVSAIFNGNFTATQSLTVSTTPVTVASIDAISLSTGDTLRGLQSTEAAQLVVSVTFSDGSKLDNAFTSSGQVIANLLSITGSNDSVFAISNAGVVTILDNTPDTVSVTVTVDGLNRTLEFHSNLDPSIGQIDLGDITTAPVQAPGSYDVPFTVPVRINVGHHRLSGLEIAMSYDSDVLDLVSVSKGSDWTGSYFSHSLTRFTGFVHFGGVLTSPLNGTIEIASIQFRAKSDSTATSLKATPFMLLNADGDTILADASTTNITVLFNYTYLPSLTDNAIALHNLSPVQTVCNSTLPCDCTSPEQGDINGDCVFDIKDIQSFYGNQTLYNGKCIIGDYDYNLDGQCTAQDVVYLLRVNFHQIQFVNDFSIVPVSNELCFVSVNATMSSRGDRKSTFNDYLLVGFFHRESSFDTQVEASKPFLYGHAAAEYTSNNPATTNGGFFRTSFNNESYRLLLETQIDQEDTGIILLQAHDYSSSESASVFAEIMTGALRIPETYAEELISTVQVIDGLTVSFNRDLGFSPITVISQNFTSDECINFNRPVFQPQNASFEVYENFQVGNVVGIVFANDSDALDNAVVLYAFFEATDDVTSTFSINETTGEIYLISSLNRESIPSYTIGLIARDRGKVNTLSGYGSVTITVLDVNDNYPQFVEVVNVTHQPIPENIPTNTPIIRVSATDIDFGENSTITYHLTGSSYPFEINSTSGVIYNEFQLNYENQSFYNLTIEARDGGSPPKSTYISLPVIVSPINEHPPICDPTSRLAVVPEDIATDTEFYTITAYDNDKGSNHSTLTYSVSPSHQFDIRKISDMEAVLFTVTNDFNRKTSPHHIVTVSVMDGGSLMCQINVTIIVGEPTTADIFISDGDQAHFIDTPTLTSLNTHSQNVTFFIGNSPRTTISTRLPNTDYNSSVTIERSPLAPSNFYSFLHRLTVYEDDPFVSTVTVSYDASFNAVSSASHSITLSLTPVNTSVAPFTSSVVCSSICTSSIEVPKEWFHLYDHLNVNATVGTIASKYIGQVSLVATPAYTLEPDNLFMHLPYHPIHDGGYTTVPITSLATTTLTAFHFTLNFANVLQLTSISSANWACDSVSTATSLSAVCYRHSYSDILTPLNTTHLMDVTFHVSSNVSNALLTGSVNSQSSHYGTLSYEKPLKVIDRDGLSDGSGYIYTRSKQLMSVFSVTQGEVINYSPFGINTSVPFTVYGVYSDQTHQQLTSGLHCNSTADIVHIDSDCQSIHLTPHQTGHRDFTPVHVTHSSGHAYTQYVRVWYPIDIRLEAIDDVLNRIDYGNGCNDTYQTTSVRVYARFTTGIATSPEVRVSAKSLISTNTAVADIDSNSQIVSGKQAGVTQIMIAGYPNTSIQITVSSDVVKPYDIYPIVFNSLTISSDSLTYSRDSTIEITTQYNYSNYQQSSVDMLTYMYFTDGSRVFMNDITISSLASNHLIQVIGSNQFRAVGTGDANVEIKWRPCHGGSHVDFTKVVSVNPPSLTSLSIQVADSRLSLNADLDMPDNTMYSVTGMFSDGSTLDLSTAVELSITGALTIDTSTNTISARNDGSTFATLSATLVYNSTTITSTVDVAVVHVVGIEAYASHYPTSPLSLDKEITLSPIADSGIWEEGIIQVYAVLSDNSTQLITNWAITGLTPSFLNINSGIISRNSGNNVQGNINIIYGAVFNDYITVMIDDTPVTIDSVSLVLNEGQLANERTIIVQPQLSDGVNLTWIDLHTFNNSFNFTIYPSHVATVEHDELTILNNHYEECILQVTATGGESANATFIANLPADLSGEIDIGQTEGIPQPPVSVGSNFTTDVRVNVSNRQLHSYQLELFYNPLVLEVLSVHLPLKSYCVHRTRSPEGIITILCTSVNDVTSQAPTIAQVVWNPIHGGVTNINADFRVFDASLQDFSLVSNSRILPISVVSSSVISNDVHPVGGLSQDVTVIADMTYCLIGRQTCSNITDVNFDNIINTVDAIHLTRATAGLVPLLSALPEIIPVSSSNECRLSFTASIRNDLSGSSVHFYFLVSDGDVADFSSLLDVTTGHNKSILSESAGLFEATTADNMTYTASLFTPLNYRQEDIGLSMFVLTTDGLMDTSLDRIASFVGSSNTVTANRLNFNLSVSPSLTVHDIQLGQRVGLYSLVNFTNDLRSDYCEFNNSVFEVPEPIPEDYLLNKIFYNVTAVRSGFPIDYDIYYYITDEYSGVPFTIQLPFEGSLIVSDLLDYDNISTSYTFTVGIKYNSTDELIGTASVTVRLSDVNDNPPIFDVNETVIFVPEDRAVNSTITHVHATDADGTSPNNLFTYSIDPILDLNNTFQVNETTGEITLSKPLDRERVDFYKIVVLATDNGDRPMTGTTIVFVNVEDINDNSPVFYDDPYVVRIPENYYENETVMFLGYKINVNDSDLGVNGSVSLDLEGSAAFDITDDGEILINEPLDREHIAIYHLTVIATDMGAEPRTSTASLTIRITDINDNAPYFIAPSKTDFIIEEDNPIGYVIATVRADDADIGTNALIEFSIVDENNFFDINNETGEVYILNQLAVADGVMNDIVIIATDKGSPSMFNSTTFTVSIIEGQIIVIDAGNKGYLIDGLIRKSETVYSQNIGYFFGEELHTNVEVMSRVGTAFSREFETIYLPNTGGPAERLEGVILQDKVYHSQRTVTVVIQAFNVHDSIARPTLVRVQINPFSSLASLYDADVFAYCTTSVLGYCVARATIPDAWIDRNSSNPTADMVSVFIDDVASSNDNGNSIKIGQLEVEVSPATLPNFLTTDMFGVIGPSHTVYTNGVFRVPVYIKSPLNNGFYTRVVFNVATQLNIEGFLSGQFFSCSILASNNAHQYDCNVLSPLLPDGVATLKIIDIIVKVPNDYTMTSAIVSINNFQLYTGSTYGDTLPSKTAGFTIETEAISHVLPTILQPDLVNMATLDGSAVFTSNIYYTAFNNSIAFSPLSTPYPGILIEPDNQIVCDASRPTVSLSADCKTLSVHSTSTDVGPVNVSFTSPSLTLLSTRAIVYVWAPINVDLIITDNKLSPVNQWKHGPSCTTSDFTHQTSRIKIYTTLSNGYYNFTTDNTKQLLPKVQFSDASIAVIDDVYGLIKPTGSPGTTDVYIPKQSTPSGIWSLKNITVSTNEVLNHVRLDPIIASLRLFVSDPSQSRYSSNEVSLELYSILFYPNERTEVSVSILLSDGRRLLITDPNEILLESTNTSVVSIDNNYIIAVSEGIVDLRVSWVVCSVKLLERTIQVEVRFNQFRPVFIQSSGDAIIPENSPIGTVIATVEATDQDNVLVPDDIQYSIRNDIWNGLFAVDPITGVVTLNGPLDREYRDNYTVLIDATDSVQRQQLKCFEQQQTAEPPTEDTTDMDSGSGSASGAYSGSGDNSSVTPPPPTPSPCEPVNPNYFTLTILIGDINDNPPVCPSSTTTIYVLNNITVNAIIGNFQATDEDVGENAEITYGLSNSGSSAFFAINSTNGDISVDIPLSSSIIHYPFQVVASDSGNLTALCGLLVEVYRFYDTVTITLMGNISNFNPTVFSQLLGNLLDYEIHVANIRYINNTAFSIDIFALDGQGAVQDPDVLEEEIIGLSDENKNLMEEAGFTIIYTSVNSNKPSTEPPTGDIDRQIPEWAVAIIVVLNSVIIISLLMVIVAILWRRIRKMREDERKKHKDTSLLPDLDQLEGPGGPDTLHGGMIDPKTGKAVQYERRVEIEMMETQTGRTNFIKRTVEKTSWLGLGGRPPDQLLDDDDSDDEPPPPHIEKNPLYSLPDTDEVDFSNPAYRLAEESTDDRVITTTMFNAESIEMDELIPLSPQEMALIDNQSEDKPMKDSDTLY
jgi:hypothetical protein